MPQCKRCLKTGPEMGPDMTPYPVPGTTTRYPLPGYPLPGHHHPDVWGGYRHCMVWRPEAVHQASFWEQVWTLRLANLTDQSTTSWTTCLPTRPWDKAMRDKAMWYRPWETRPWDTRPWVLNPWAMSLESWIHESWVLSPESWVLNLESWVLSLESWVLSLEYWDLRLETWDWRLESWVLNLETCDLSLESWDLRFVYNFTYHCFALFCLENS